MKARLQEMGVNVEFLLANAIGEEPGDDNGKGGENDIL
jgi:hypothetical protein